MNEKPTMFNEEGYSKGYKDGYAKAIDEFAEQTKELSECGEISVFGWNRVIDEIAEQMKGGAIDG